MASAAVVIVVVIVIVVVVAIVLVDFLRKFLEFIMRFDNTYIFNVFYIQERKLLFGWLDGWMGIYLWI